MKRKYIDVAEMHKLIAHHYLKYGKPIFSVELSRLLGVARSTLEKFILYREDEMVNDCWGVNPDTCGMRSRNSRCYLPTIIMLRSMMVTDYPVNIIQIRQPYGN